MAESKVWPLTMYLQSFSTAGFQATKRAWLMPYFVSIIWHGSSTPAL